MNSVRCPICEQRLVSEDSAGLSATLEGHLSEQHDIQIQRESGRFGSPMTLARDRGGWRGAEHRREEQTWAPEAGTDIPPRPRGIGDWAKKAVGANEEAGGREEWARGQGYPSMTERPSERSTSEQRYIPPEGRRTDNLVCPMCGQAISGTGEDELTAALEDHFRSEHRIVPRVTTR